MEVKLFENKVDCCGCGACVNICPRDAIRMEEDEYGFLYPQITKELCIQCGACQRVCAYQNVTETNEPKEAYAFTTVNTDILESASGGFFASIAKRIIEDGGIAYGVAFSEQGDQLVPIHKGVDDHQEMKELLGSKYVQSSVGMQYRKIKREAESGRLVVFSGTPCQVAGLKSYLKVDYPNVLLIDLVCHGVPSVKFFHSYISFLEKRIRGKAIGFKFRDKTYGWGMAGRIDYVTNTGKKKSKPIFSGESSYFSMFLESEIYRENCYKCKYACRHRPGDITMGDYWGIEKEHPEILKKDGNVFFDQYKGISCVVVNSKKGQKYIEKYKDAFRLYPSTYEKVARGNDQLRSPSKKGKNREMIMELYREDGYIGIEKWFRKNAGYKRYVMMARNHFPRQLKGILRKIKHRVIA